MIQKWNSAAHETAHAHAIFHRIYLRLISISFLRFQSFLYLVSLLHFINENHWIDAASYIVIHPLLLCLSYGAKFKPTHINYREGLSQNYEHFIESKVSG